MDLFEGEPDWLKHFDNPKLDGYYAERGSGVILSLIISREENKGHVSNLLKDWMEKYDSIIVPTPSNKMRGICERRGFKSEIVNFEDGDSGECMVWRK